jgi:hypothetical protein
MEILTVFLCKFVSLCIITEDKFTLDCLIKQKTQQPKKINSQRIDINENPVTGRLMHKQ